MAFYNTQISSFSLSQTLKNGLQYLSCLGLTEEQADKVVVGYGAMIPKTRFDKINTAKKQLETDIALRDKQLEELEKVDAAGLQVKITELQTANTEAKFLIISLELYTRLPDSFIPTLIILWVPQKVPQVPPLAMSG